MSRLIAAALAAALLLSLCSGCGGDPATSAGGTHSDGSAPVSDLASEQPAQSSGDTADSTGTTTAVAGSPSSAGSSRTTSVDGLSATTMVTGTTTTTVTHTPAAGLPVATVSATTTAATNTTTVTTAAAITTGTAAPQSPAYLTYEQYHALSGDQQLAYMESFPSMADYFTWYNAAKKEYEENQDRIEVSDGQIDLGGSR